MIPKAWLCAVLLALPLASKAGEVAIESLRVPKAPSAPDDPAWAKAAPAVISLMPQALVLPRGCGTVKSVKVRALRDKAGLSLLLEWTDPAPDELPSAAESFADACAVQMPAAAGSMPSPFMGDRENPVVIWRWSASAQRDIDEGRQPRTKVRPHMAWDGAPLLEKETETLAGEKAGNVLSRRDRRSPVEFLGARGFGTLTAFAGEPVQGKGFWSNGSWKVVFSRARKGDPDLEEGARIPVAFAVWDGGASERNGLKSLSVWHTLSLGAPAPESQRDAVARGKRVFDRYGCASCHGAGGVGGVKNPNAQGGEVPPLQRVKEGFSEEEIRKVIFEGRASVPEDPRGPAPPLHMNSWKVLMDEAEVGDLVKYLFSLMPQEKGAEW